MADDMHMLYAFVHTVLRLTSLKITQEFQLLLGITENKTVFWGFTIRSTQRLDNGGLDNGDMDNQSSTVQENGKT